ncbi:MAG: DUF4373 domain-containing protein [Bacteroidia bacterium]|nr:DUF4373 domain-containing protein [Bacteroidia bacterium]
MKDTFYFSHDYNARQDFKIKKLHRQHGSLGYGIFWSLVEDLYNNANALPLDYDSMAYEYKTDANLVKSVIHDFGLFTYSKEEFGSLSVQKRLDERAIKSQKARDSAHKRWSQVAEIQTDDANALQTDSDGNAIKKEIEETKKEIYVENEFSTPLQTLEQLYKTVNKNGNDVSNFIIDYKPLFPDPYKDVWNIFAERYSFAKVSKITSKRLTSLKNRLKENEFDFIEILKMSGKSKGLTGASWFSFDFLISNDTNYIKVLEGKYLKSFIDDKKTFVKEIKYGAQSKQLTPEQLKAMSNG